MTAATSAICGFFCSRFFGGDADGLTGAEEDVVDLWGGAGLLGAVAFKLNLDDVLQSVQNETDQAHRAFSAASVRSYALIQTT